MASIIGLKMIVRKVLCGEFDGTNGRIRTIGGNSVEYAADGTMRLIWNMDNNIQYRADGKLSVLFGRSVSYHSDKEIGLVGNAIATYNGDGTINNIGGIRFEYYGDPYFYIKERPAYQSVFRPEREERRDPIPVFNTTIPRDFSYLRNQPLEAAEQKEQQLRRFLESRLRLARSLANEDWHSVTSLGAGTPDGFKEMFKLIRQAPALDSGKLLAGFQRIASTRCGATVVRSFFPNGTRDITLRNVYAGISTATSIDEISDIIDKELKKFKERKKRGVANETATPVETQLSSRNTESRKFW
jgi:hypothetical protein